MYLMRSRIASQLAILAGSGDVMESDSEWAKVVWDVSSAVRDAMIKHGKDEAAQVEAEARALQAGRAIHVDEAKERRAVMMTTAVMQAARHVQRQKCVDGCKRRCITRSIAGKYMKGLDMGAALLG
jgi:hypothetical protein